MLSGEKIKSESPTEIEKLYRHYSMLEEKLLVYEQSTKTTYRSPVNFLESMQRPRHRWFPYKEGFSPSFVKDFLSAGTPSKRGLVLDPFSGSGTTAIVAGENGFRGMGYDVSPLTDFVAKTKAITMNATELSLLKKQIAEFENSKLDAWAPAPNNETVKRYFEIEYLASILRVKAYYLQISCPKIAALFKLSFLTAVETFSTHRKAGNGVKRKTKYTSMRSENECISNVKDFIATKLKIFAADIEQSSDFRPPEFMQKSCLGDALPDEITDVSTVLTSPPYANCFDYSKIYMSELWLGDFFTSKADQQTFREASVRSHVHASWDERYSGFGAPIVNNIIKPHLDAQDLWSPRIGGMLSGYFSDLGNLLENLKPRMISGGKLGFVVGNSFYGGVAIATDLLLAELALNRGYEVEQVRVYRGTIPSSQQFLKLGDNRKYMRESMVVLRRP